MAAYTTPKVFPNASQMRRQITSRIHRPISRMARRRHFSRRQRVLLIHDQARKNGSMIIPAHARPVRQRKSVILPNRLMAPGANTFGKRISESVIAPRSTDTPMAAVPHMSLSLLGSRYLQSPYPRELSLSSDYHHRHVIHLEHRSLYTMYTGDHQLREGLFVPDELVLLAAITHGVACSSFGPSSILDSRSPD